jgi:hypothetical protein
MKKQKLISDFNFDFDLLGITTSVKDYKLTWAINKHLFLQLKRQEDHKINAQNKIKAFTFFYDEPAPEVRLRLFSNKPVGTESTIKNLLIPEAPHFDFIFMREGESQSFSLNSLQESLKDVPVIEYLAKINSLDIRFKEYFVF